MLKETLINATEAGAAVLKYYYNNKDLKISNKEGVNNLVTEADHASEKAIVETIREAFPDHFILTEEAGELRTESNVKWIVDPIDGTVNYAHGIPLCAVSIGEFFMAERGKGAWLNGEKISVSTKSTVMDSCFVTGFPYTYLDVPNGPLAVFDRFIRKGIPVRRLGSAAIDLCWVAAGRFDGFFEHKLQAWDSAAGFLMVEEAGGKITDYAGNYYSPYQPQIFASNGIIHKEGLDWINDKV